MTVSSPERKKKRGLALSALKSQNARLRQRLEEERQLLSGINLRRALLLSKNLRDQRGEGRISPGVIEMLSLLIEDLRSQNASSEEIAEGVANLLQQGPLKLIGNRPTRKMIDAATYDWPKWQALYAAAHDGDKGNMYEHVWAAMHDNA